MKLKVESVLPKVYNSILQLRGLDIPEDVMEDTIKIPVYAFSKFLGLKKNREDNGTSLVLRDEKGNFVIAGVVRYHAPEKEDQAGNWSYEYTFTEEDIKETHQYVVTDASFIEVMAKASVDHSIAITDHNFAFDMIICFFEALKNILDENVSISEECELELEGFFTAVSVIESDEKVFSLIPSGEMKRLIKDDSTLED